MRSVISAMLVALCAASLAACDNRAAPSASSGASSQAPAESPSSTPTTPANIGQPSSRDEKREGANPQQGQVDPKESVQHKDFRQPGDAAGPSGPDTTPRR